MKEIIMIACALCAVPPEKSEQDLRFEQALEICLANQAEQSTKAVAKCNKEVKMKDETRYEDYQTSVGLVNHKQGRNCWI